MQDINSNGSASLDDEVAERIGVLNGATEHLRVFGPLADQVDPKNLGEWVGVFLKALASVLKI